MKNVTLAMMLCLQTVNGFVEYVETRKTKERIKSEGAKEFFAGCYTYIPSIVPLKEW